MPYLGRSPVIGSYKKIDDITSQFTGAQTVFTLQAGGTNVTPGTPQNLIISLGGVLQEPGVAYTVNASTLTFTGAPANTQPFFGVMLGDAVDVGYVSDGIAINVSSLRVGANVLANTSTILVGNSSVNTNITTGVLTLGANVVANTSTVLVGNSSVNTSITAGTVKVNGLSLATILLKSNSGTTTNTSAENVDTIAISGLTAKDKLIVFFFIGTVTQSAAGASLYSSTDSKVLMNLTNGTTITAGSEYSGLISVQVDPAGTTLITSRGYQSANQPTTDSEVFNLGVRGGNATVTTPWTGSWTLALRQLGVTSGGTVRWSWAVYKLLGQ